MNEQWPFQLTNYFGILHPSNIHKGYLSTFHYIVFANSKLKINYEINLSIVSKTKSKRPIRCTLAQHCFLASWQGTQLDSHHESNTAAGKSAGVTDFAKLHFRLHAQNSFILNIYIAPLQENYY